MLMSQDDIKNLFNAFARISRSEAKIDTSKLRLDEDLCHRCGLCCHEKILVIGLNGKANIEYVDSKAVCPFLNSDNQCAVYEHKNTARPTCLNAKQALLSCILPASCGYVKANWDIIKNWYNVPVVKYHYE